ncbi:MAG: hypothetical protein HYU64_02515 [Armatimonadetes bacterium]|nr:hypothetical protein [Armatimonadota bacterium]
MRPGRVLGIDIGSTSLKAALLERGKGNSRARLSAVRVFSISGEDRESLIGKLRELRRDPHFAAASLSFSLPRRFLLLKSLSLPPAPPEKIRALVEMEVSTALPLPRDRMTWDFGLRPGPEEGKTADLWAAKTETLDVFREIFEQSGWDLSDVVPSPVAAQHFAEFCLPAMACDLLLVDMGRLHLESALVREGALVASRTAPCGSLRLSQGTAREKWLSTILHEIRDIQGSGHEAVKRKTTLLLGGGGAKLPGVLSSLEQELAIVVKGVGHLDSSRLLLTEDAEAAYLAVGAALATLQDSPKAVHLIPGDWREKDRTKAAERTFLLAAKGALFALAMVGLWFLAGILARTDTLRKLEEAEVRIHTPVRRLEQKEREVAGYRSAQRFLAGLEKRKQRPLELLRELSIRISPPITIQRLSLEKEKGFSLSGRAPSQKEVALLLGSLRNLPGYGEAQLNFVRSITTEDFPVVDFSIWLPVSKKTKGRSIGE